jgi:hypothetical protein
LPYALAEACGQRPLYVIADAYKSWHPFPEQISSFSRSYVETQFRRYVLRPPPRFLETLPVCCVDWRTVVRDHDPFHLVAIDTEGYDGEILHEIDLSNSAPEIIVYEHRHLTRSMRARSVERLEKAGYAVRPINKADTIAVDSRLAASLDAEICAA